MFSSLSPEKKIFVVIFWFVVGFFFPIHTNSVGDFWKSFDVNEDFHEPGCTLEGVCSTSCGLRRLKSAMRCPGKCWAIRSAGNGKRTASRQELVSRGAVFYEGGLAWCSPFHKCLLLPKLRKPALIRKEKPDMRTQRTPARGRRFSNSRLTSLS